MTIIRSMVKGATFQSESILCSVEKGEIVRSIALAIEIKYQSSIIHERNSAVEMSRSAGYCRM